MTMHRADQLGQHSVEWPAALGLQRAGFAGGGDTPPDPVEAYFECITTCSLDDGDCVTTCTEILREHS
jgi:hypothetical protein